MENKQAEGTKGYLDLWSEYVIVNAEINLPGLKYQSIQETQEFVSLNVIIQYKKLQKERNRIDYEVTAA